MKLREVSENRTNIRLYTSCKRQVVNICAHHASTAIYILIDVINESCLDNDYYDYNSDVTV